MSGESATRASARQSAKYSLVLTRARGSMKRERGNPALRSIWSTSTPSALRRTNSTLGTGTKSTRIASTPADQHLRERSVGEIAKTVKIGRATQFLPSGILRGTALESEARQKHCVRAQE